MSSSPSKIKLVKYTKNKCLPSIDLKKKKKEMNELQRTEKQQREINKIKSSLKRWTTLINVRLAKKQREKIHY